MNHTIVSADAGDSNAILKLLPRLADFDVPTQRRPEDLWQGDADMFRAWVAGERPDIEVLVAKVYTKIVGCAIVSFRKELLSGEPSAHLEVLVLCQSAEGQGIATALMEETEVLCKNKGAKWMSLHVFSNNTRARALYERQGFDGELLRYSKPLA